MPNNKPTSAETIAIDGDPCNQSDPDVFFISIPHRFDNPQSMSSDRLMQLCGLNTGNLLFTNAVRRQIRWKTAEGNFNFDPDDVNKRFDLLVIPAANWLSESFDFFAGLADRIEAIRIPVVIIGIGAQAADGGGITKVPPDTVRLMRAISERSVLIGARGEFTKTVLEHYGIKNVQVTGCPSLYWDGENQRRVEKSPYLKSITLGSTGYAGSMFHEEGASINQLYQRAIYRLAYRSRCDIVYQSERPEIDYLVNPDALLIDEKLIESALWYYAADDKGAWFDFLRKSGKCFFDAEQWINRMRNTDFYLGSRLHGAIASLLSGTPACILTHDTRTSEVSQFAGIPSCSLWDIKELSMEKVEEIYRRVDYGDWASRYAENLSNYAEFLAENGVPHRLFSGPRDASSLG